MLYTAHQGYIYQDILGAYFVAQEFAHGKRKTKFHFDYKKTPSGVPDKFDDLVVYHDIGRTFIQVKYSNDEHQHTLTKDDLSSRRYDLALFDLFETWNTLHTIGDNWRICLAWDIPLPDDPIQTVLVQLPDNESLLPETICYRINCDALWPPDDDVLSSWRALKNRASHIDRTKFKAFLDCLTLEVNCPKSTLLQDYSQGLEKQLAHTIQKIGIGIYPNDHLTVRQVAESLCTITKRRRSTDNVTPISCDEIAQAINLIQTNGGIEQKFTVDENVLVATPKRIDQVISVLDQHGAVILTAEPGAGKSWFIENLQTYLQETTQVIKHYCYIALEDPLILERITVNVLYGSLITQILQNDENLGSCMTMRYASNLEQLNILLNKIEKKTLLIIDGVDHVWRVYQKNRGGLTENATKIIQALSQLDSSNPNVSLLIVSQPIDQLTELTDFYHCTLAQLSEDFVEELLEKHSVSNIKVEDVSLAHVIHEKSNGNALYCKYLVDHAVSNKTHSSFAWIDELPSYEFNLTSYYQYLYEQIQSDTNIPYALCGAEFSVTEIELKEITHLGDLVSIQLTHLRPILKYTLAMGYSIYHESFKRFVIDTIKEQGASIDHLVYLPLIGWLKQHSFFESTKAYGHLLKLYYEVGAYNEIAQTISVDFLDSSLYNGQPFHRIRQNHYLQKASLQYINEFTSIIILAEQSKIVYELEHNITDQVLINYLKATQEIHDDHTMYRFLWDGEHLLVDTKDALAFLVNKVYQGEKVVHWSVIPHLASIPYDILGLVIVKLLHKNQYEEFDTLVKKVYEDPNHEKGFSIILNEIEWFCIHIGDDWMQKTPYFRGIVAKFTPSIPTLTEAVDHIIANDRIRTDDNWEIIVRDIMLLTKIVSNEEIATAIDTLSHYNWFRNWLVFLIKITDLSNRDYRSKEVIEAFSYLVRDLEPFKGNPRASDLYNQLPFIKKSFHWGLLLCNGHEGLLIQCCELLEKVTNLTTSLQRSFSGPLTDETYLELISFYLPKEYIIDKYSAYYDSLGSYRLYSDFAQIAFEYAHVLSRANMSNKAREKHIEGIKSLTAYRFRKDRTLSEVLYSSVPYHQTYGSLDVKWFYELYHMAMTVVTHTDGRSTNRYPIEWFEEFIKVYPDEALKFLITETFENKEANWYQEDEFHYILEEYASLFSATQWFLLCRSLPLVSSEKIIAHGLTILEQIDEELLDIYRGWLRSRPYIVKPDPEKKIAYSEETVSRYKAQFDTSLKLREKSSKTSSTQTSSLLALPTTSGEEALIFLDTNKIEEAHASDLHQLLHSIFDLEERKTLLRQVAKNFRYGRDVEEWVNDLFKENTYDWFYFNVCLFVFATDGWFHGLHYTQYLKRAYEADPTQTINLLKEVLGYYLADDGATNLVACNLIKVLSELQVEEKLVHRLLQMTFQIVKHRLPHPPNSEINQSLYQGLEGMSRDEIVVALLIARLKTLTTEKTQGIIWSLTFIARTAPKTLLKPYFWAFSHHTFLLPIHRAVLLQILKEYIDPRLIPDGLIGQFLNIYPTGFFLEDQYIRSFVDYKIELDENSAKSIQFPAHQYDEWFFPYSHFKYIPFANYFDPLTGTYSAYAYKRDEIRNKHESYAIRTEKIMTPIVSLANASYEIINSQYYGSLKRLTYSHHPSYTCDLRFFLDEIIIQAGALTKRPSYLPTPENFPDFEVRNISSPFEHEGWIILASKEKELYGEIFEQKNTRTSSLVFTFGQKPTPDSNSYAQYLFNANQYTENIIDNAPFDQPICKLIIVDFLERSSIVYVSPFIVRDLDLTIDSVFHNGFQARNDKGETIIKMAIWKEDYYGDISDGTEVPCLEGVAVMIRDDYYERLLTLYQKEGRIILSQGTTED